LRQFANFQNYLWVLFYGDPILCLQCKKLSVNVPTFFSALFRNYL
jgi:hypothetical protein